MKIVLLLLIAVVLAEQTFQEAVLEFMAQEGKKDEKVVAMFENFERLSQVEKEIDPSDVLSYCSRNRNVPHKKWCLFFKMMLRFKKAFQEGVKGFGGDMLNEIFAK